jgi:phosphoserine phosphatase
LISSKSIPKVGLSKPEFFHSVLASPPKVAVFDCDGTLWGGDAGYGFMVWSLEQGIVSRNASDWLDSRYRLYLKDEVSEAGMCGEMVQVYAGLREAEIRKAAADYFNGHIRAQIFPEMVELVARLREAGTEFWAVSSTNNWVIEEGVRDFGIPADRILAARVKVKAGIVTSELIDVPTDEAKAAALVRVGVPSPDAVFGNSIHDAAMLEIAKRPFPVNPSPELVKFAAQREWPVFYPEHTGA